MDGASAGLLDVLVVRWSEVLRNDVSGYSRRLSTTRRYLSSRLLSSHQTQLPSRAGRTLRTVSTPTEATYATLHRLGQLGRELERRRTPDPYPRPTGPPPSLEQLRRRSGEIERVAARHGASRLRVFGSVARGEAGPGSDVDILVDMGQRRGLLARAALQGDLEQLLGCPVHVVTASGLTHARKPARERIEREAVSL